jgi:hypothetical protein
LALLLLCSEIILLSSEIILVSRGQIVRQADAAGCNGYGVAARQNQDVGRPLQVVFAFLNDHPISRELVSDVNQILTFGF